MSCKELLLKKKSIWFKTHCSYSFLKPSRKSYCLAVDPYCWLEDRHAQSCDLDEERVTSSLNSSRLFYITCCWIYVTTHFKPLEDWCEWWAKMVANLNVFENNCVLSKLIFSFTDVHWVMYRIRGENERFWQFGHFNFIWIYIFSLVSFVFFFF